MKRVISVIIGFCLILLITVPVWAGPWRIENGAKVIDKAEVVQGDLIFNGEQLRVDGTVTGDLIIQSGEVVINGTIKGDLIGFTGGKVTINGLIGRNLRVLAQEIEHNGNIEGCATVMSFRFEATPHSRIGAGLMGTFLDLSLAGRIDGPVELTGYHSTRIGGRIAGDLKVDGVETNWSPPLEILGKVSDATVKANDPSKLKGVKLGGYRFTEGNLTEQYQVLKYGMIVLFVWLVGSLLLSLVFYRLFPRTVWSMSEPSMVNFRRSLLGGLLCLIGTPFLIYLLCRIVVGIPIAIVILLLYLLLISGFAIPVYLWLGRLIFNSRLRPRNDDRHGGIISDNFLLHLAGLFIIDLLRDRHDYREDRIPIPGEN